MEGILQDGPSRTDKIIAQLKKHPLVPGGMIATCGALGMAFRRLHQRDSAGYQRWLRARVLAQGLTIVAIVAAGVQEFGTGAFMGTTKNASGALAPPPMSPSERVAFEKRMREAEDAHLAEARILDQGRPSSSALLASSPLQNSLPSHSQPSDKNVPTEPASSSSFSWLKFWR